jgi:uncharacterized MAPEG superfamily protein
MYPYWTLMCAAILPYVWAFTAAAFKYKQMGKIDLQHPRKQAEALEGPGYRANAAQSNAWEALAVFSVSFLTAVAANVPAENIWLLAVLWVGLRVLHGITYVMNLAPLRVAAFAGGTFCSFAILVQALL